MFVPLPLLILLGLLVAVAVLVALRSRRQGGSDLIAPPSRPVERVVFQTLPRGTLPPETDARVRALVRADEIIKAIVLVRETTGLGLKEAKDLVDEMR